MTGKMKWMLAALAALSVTGAIPVLAEEKYELSEVVVTGEREKAAALPGGFQRESTNLGLLGDTDVMKVPFTAQSFSEKTMETMVSPMGDLNQVLLNSPSIRGGTTPIKSDFSIRGIGANASAMYMNGVPGLFIMCIGPVTNSIGRTDVLVGPAATLNGSTQSFNTGHSTSAHDPVATASPAGAVYLYSKRPDGDFNRYTQSIGGYGDYGEYIDISRTNLGGDGSWGLRVYGQYDKGGLAISGAERAKKNIFADISRETEKSKTNIFAGYYDDQLWGTERRVAIHKNATSIPKALDGSKSYDDPDAMQSHWYGWMFTVNHEQKINDNVKWFVNAGMHEGNNRRMIYDGTIEFNAAGTNFSNDTTVWTQYYAISSRYIQGGLNFKAETGDVKHDITVSLDRSYRKQWKNDIDTGDVSGFGSVFMPGSTIDRLIFNPGLYSFDVSDSLAKVFMYQEMNTSLNLMDKMSVGKWDVLAAVTRRHSNFRGPGKQQMKDDNWSPTFGFSYAPNDSTSIYAAYAKATSRGTVVNAKKYDNQGELLDPAELENKEIGIKRKWNNFYASLAYFDMKQPNALEMDSSVVAGKKHYALNGENRYKGVDFNMTGRVARKWNIFGGFEYLYARQEKTAYGAMDGLPTDSSAKWSAVLGAEYTPNKDWSLTARMNYTGTGVVLNGENQELKVPSSTVFDFFARYKTHIGSVPVTFQGSVYNVFNKDYWILQPGQGRKLMISMPRTFVLSASFDF